MCAQTLRSYFETERQQRRALKALGDYFDPTELDLYDASQRAFDPSSSNDEAFRNFTKIHGQLGTSHWGAFRPYSPADARCWQPQKIFEKIKREFSDWPWRGPVNLLNFPTSETVLRLEPCLEKMREIKPNKGYPIMTVSKFLHFYNPALFPIYDEAVIWEKVLDGYFRSDFRDFCDHENLPYRRFRSESTVDFIPAYMRLANSLLSAHGRFMQVFAGWLAEQPGTELHRRTFGPTTLYARAFEYAAIGAAKVEQMAHLRRFIRDCRQALPRLSLSKADRQQAEAELQTAETQAHSTKPESKVIQSALAAMKKILRGASDSAATQELLKRLRRLTPWL